MQAKMVIQYVLVILITITTEINYAQVRIVKTTEDIIVISPGIQGGYTINEGWFWGIQFTGSLWEGQGYKEKIRGLIVGRRWTKDKVITYFDIQRSFIVPGYGVGLARIKDKQGIENSSIGLHMKTWAGYFALWTYDVIIQKEKKNPHNVGLMGVVPILSEK